MFIKPVRLRPDAAERSQGDRPKASAGGWHGWAGPSISIQILGLLVGGLVVAQFVTLLLTLVLPPKPAARHELDDIASALRGRGDAMPDTLRLSVQKSAPQASGPGWLESERSRSELAALLDADENDVRLFFYTPLPFAGTANPLRAEVGRLRTAVIPGMQIKAASFLPPAQMRSAASQNPRFPGGMDTLRGGNRPSTLPGFPGTLERGNDPIRRDVGGNDWLFGNARPQAGEGAQPAMPPIAERLEPAFGHVNGLRSAPSQSGSPVAMAGAAGRRPGAPRALQRPASADRNYPGSWFQPPALAIQAEMKDEFGLLETSKPLPPAPVTSGQMRQDGPAKFPTASSVVPPPPTVGGKTPDAVAPEIVSKPPRREITAESPATVSRRGLFGLAPEPFVEGDFIAALRLSDGRWAVAQPVPEPFPNAWQRRVLLWFAVAIAIVGPLGWLFARRIVTPLSGFAYAAEQLGRDPAGPVRTLRGPGELGRAANAFNLMHNRLRAFIDDRTTMVGAISHDLRTPLTRLRFRIEDIADNGLRDGIIAEVDEMEAMIGSVLDYLRDATASGRREHVDLAGLLDAAVKDAMLVGGDIAVVRNETAIVEAEVLGIRRILDNLIQNAVKYGRDARVRLAAVGGMAVVEIIDGGGGVPDDELEQVFTPFYRSRAASASGKPGSGLGLAVCRSIARAHGGDVQLEHTEEGFIARLLFPLAFDTAKAGLSPAGWSVEPQASHCYRHSAGQSTSLFPRRESRLQADVRTSLMPTQHAAADG